MNLPVASKTSLSLPPPSNPLSTLLDLSQNFPSPALSSNTFKTFRFTNLALGAASLIPLRGQLQNFLYCLKVLDSKKKNLMYIHSLI